MALSLVPKKVKGDRQKHAQRDQHEDDHVRLKPTPSRHPVNGSMHKEERDRIPNDIDRHDGFADLFRPALHHIGDGIRDVAASKACNYKADDCCNLHQPDFNRGE